MHSLPKWSGPFLETNGVLMMLIKPSSSVTSMAWIVLERIYARTWLNLWCTWGTTHAHLTRTCVSSPEFIPTYISTNPTYCTMSTEFSSFITMIRPCSTILISTLNWSLNQSVIPTCIFDPIKVITGPTLVCMPGHWAPPSTWERLLITMWRIWGRIFIGSICYPSKPQIILCMNMSLIFTDQSHLNLNEPITFSPWLE